MTPWALYFLAAFGLAYIVGHSKITLPLRLILGGIPALRDEEGKVVQPPVPGRLGPVGDFLAALLECPACFGFWEGVVGSAFMSPPVSSAASPLALLGWAFVLGSATSGANFILGRLTRLM